MLPGFTGARPTDVAVHEGARGPSPKCRRSRARWRARPRCRPRRSRRSVARPPASRGRPPREAVTPTRSRRWRGRLPRPSPRPNPGLARPLARGCAPPLARRTGLGLPRDRNRGANHAAHLTPEFQSPIVVISLPSLTSRPSRGLIVRPTWGGLWQRVVRPPKFLREPLERLRGHRRAPPRGPVLRAATSARSSPPDSCSFA